MGEHSKVLIVDDEEVVRQSFYRTLSSERCQVQAALGGAEAIRLMEAENFDVVLLDLRMPGMDGLEVLRAIKERWPESEVVIITGYPSIDTAKEAVRLGAFHYLSKPVEPDEVVRATANAVMHKKWALQKDHDSGTEGSRYGYRFPWEN